MQLSQYLREGTAEKHAETEKVPYLVATFRGKLDLGTYVKQLVCLEAIYNAMEKELERHKNHTILSRLYFPEIHRSEAIRKDIEFFASKKGIQVLGSTSEATKRYMEYIQKTSESNPAMLVAQSYVRYLGDLSGGQVLRKIIAKTFQLEGKNGLEFYEFPLLFDLQAFKEKYRSILNELPLTEPEKEQLLEEAKSTFDLNKDLFLELEVALTA